MRVQISPGLHLISKAWAATGLQLYDGNPHAEGTHFADFVDDDYKLAGAIGYRKPHAGVKQFRL